MTANALSVVRSADNGARSDRSVAFGSLVGFLLVVFFLNIFGPPPPSIGAVAWSAEAMWLLVIWGYW
jgi:hypothetical protein